MKRAIARLHTKVAEKERTDALEALHNTEKQLVQSQKLEAVGRLAGGISHDFNNLLTVILGYSDITKRNLKEGDPLRRYLEEITRASERAASLTRQLLAFSRKQVMQPKVFDLNTVVTDLRKDAAANDRRRHRVESESGKPIWETSRPIRCSSNK